MSMSSFDPILRRWRDPFVREVDEDVCEVPVFKGVASRERRMNLQVSLNRTFEVESNVMATHSPSRVLLLVVSALEVVTDQKLRFRSLSIEDAWSVIARI